MNSRLALLVALFGLLALSQAAPSRDDWQWKLFKAEHSKSYSSEGEELLRMKIFADNIMKMAKHNVLYAAGEVSYEMGINRFSDMLATEVKSTMNGFRMPNGTRKATARFIGLAAHAPLPKSVDWRTAGLVTPIKDQAQCGSCWAFSTTGSLEGAHAKKTGKLVSLSEQQLLDCSSANNGCGGGNMDKAFDYISKAGGLDTEESYPYQEVQNQICMFSKSKVGATDTGFVDIESGNEMALMQAVATVGPIAIAIDAESSMQSYKGGIYYGADCTPGTLDHGVLVVGYGTENGKDYWIVKNSWGVRWGEKGYIRMSRFRENNCGISDMASYPLV